MYFYVITLSAMIFFLKQISKEEKSASCQPAFKFMLNEGDQKKEKKTK
jgi:hypothetical protein